MKATPKGVFSPQIIVVLFLIWATPGVAATPPYDETRKAAEQGSVESQFNLGLMYSEGNGVTRDYAEAAKWFRKAADQGLAVAQFSLGKMYYEGQGVTRNYMEAYVWFSHAAAQGDEKAKTALDLTEKRMPPAQIAESQKRAAAWKPTPNKR
jgi:uncharacterized protein